MNLAALSIALLFYAFLTIPFVVIAAIRRRRRLYFEQAEYLASLPPHAFDPSDEIEAERDCVT